MKNKLLLFTFVAVIFSSFAFAGAADDFKIDQKQVKAEFSDLANLEQTVIDNDFMTLSEIRNDANLSSKFSGMVPLNLPGTYDAALGIPGFWWGCIFGPIGLLVVYVVTDNDKHEVKGALTGCIVGTVVSTLLYILAFASASAI